MNYCTGVVRLAISFAFGRTGKAAELGGKNGPAMCESGAKPKVKVHSSIKGQGTSPGRNDNGLCVLLRMHYKSHSGVVDVHIGCQKCQKRQID